jgi:general secretion pathway protein G
MKKTERKRKGFTLIELLVVVLIISMLATFLAPRMFKGLGEAKSKIARAKMARIEDALARFQYDCGRLPDEADGGLEALLVAPPDLEDKWNGRYIKPSELEDPWGNPYVYVPEGQVNPGSFDLISYGADGQEGREGDNEDIFNE